MAWTTPPTWVADQLVTASDMNTYVSDNLNALKSPPGDSYLADESSNYTTSSTSFVDVDSTNFAITLTPGGTDVFVWFFGEVITSAGNVYFDVEVDDGSSPYQAAGDDGVMRTPAAAALHPIVFMMRITGLTAGQSYTFSLQWKMGAGSATLYAGAATAGYDLHPQFGAREIS